MNKDILKAFDFDEEVERIEKGKCSFCSEKINIEDFRDKLSLKEYKISGLCQKCMDKVFK